MLKGDTNFRSRFAVHDRNAANPFAQYTEITMPIFPQILVSEGTTLAFYILSGKKESVFCKFLSYSVE